MTEISFYLVGDANTPAGADAMLPALLEKILQSGHKAVVRCPDDKRLERLNEYLWSYAPESFLPHGAAADGHADKQPVYLTTQDENPGGADILVRLSGADAGDFSSYARVLDVFEGSEPQKDAARKRWKDLKDKGYPLIYWAREDGKWVKKA
ncbi:MAG: DNA polymerase III subunit chi [Proteobacteria bacterium]|nr:DNA polymerase III subunit chi [Pseudomonadota bacterium]